MKSLQKSFSDGECYLFSFANGHKFTIFIKKIPSGIVIYDSDLRVTRYYNKDLLQALKSELHKLRYRHNKSTYIKYKIQEITQIIHYAKQYISTC